MRADKLLKAKLLTSNFSTEEQIKEITKTFKLFDSKEEYYLKLNEKFYSGETFKSFSFFQEVNTIENKQQIDLGKFLGTLNKTLLLYLFDILKETNTNRFFSINIDKESIKINDFLYSKEYILEEKTGMNNVDFVIDSRIFYYFKLNQKTISKKTNILLFEKGFIILNKRKKDMLFICLK